jgi:hypothetical protein
MFNKDVSGNLITGEEAVREVTFTREGVIQLLAALPRQNVYVDGDCESDWAGRCFLQQELSDKGQYVSINDIEHLIQKVREA